MEQEMPVVWFRLLIKIDAVVVYSQIFAKNIIENWVWNF